jgi:hypothetical protein
MRFKNYLTEEDKVKYSPIKSPKKPFQYKGKWYTRDEMKKMGLDKEASKVITEARGRKAGFGTNRSDGFSYAVNIPILDSNDFVNMPFGRQLDDARKVQEWKKTAKSTHVGSKGKATLPAVRKWVKENKPTEFYAKWKMDSSNYKDDSVEIFYKN